jgi:hypothetical protein
MHKTDYSALKTQLIILEMRILQKIELLENKLFLIQEAKDEIHKLEELEQIKKFFKRKDKK